MVSDPVIGDQVITFLNVGEDVAESQRTMGPLSPYAQVVVFAFGVNVSFKFHQLFNLIKTLVIFLSITSIFVCSLPGLTFGGGIVTDF